MGKWPVPSRVVIHWTSVKSASGIGRELGPEGFAAYQTLKSIYPVGASD
jgi:hypothetical protein